MRSRPPGPFPDRFSAGRFGAPPPPQEAEAAFDTRVADEARKGEALRAALKELEAKHARDEVPRARSRCKSSSNIFPTEKISDTMSVKNLHFASRLRNNTKTSMNSANPSEYFSPPF